MILNSQRTLFAIDLEQYMLFNQPYSPLENTTLNEKFQVLSSIKPAVNTYPYLNVIVIGIGGLQNITDENSYNFSQHSPLDGALFEHIPFIVRDSNNDLTAAEKANYRLRTIEVVNNKDYVCYYGKVITPPTIKSTFHTIKTINDTTQNTAPTLSTLDMTSSEILSPKPKTRSFSYDTINGIDYVTKLNKVEFVLNVSEITEIKQGCDKLGKTSDIITELGLCTSCDFNNGNYTEAICTQVAFHIGVNFNMTTSLANNTAIQKSIELGGLEPFIK
jgi:hypothetical protein